MLNNNKYTINTENLDLLLNQAFLELDFNESKHEALLQTISNQVMLTNTFAFASQNNFIKKIIGNSNLKFLILISTTVVSIIGGVLLLNKKNENPAKPSPVINTIIQNPINTIAENKNEGKENNPAILHNNLDQKSLIKQSSCSLISLVDSVKNDLDLPLFIEPDNNDNTTIKQQPSADSSYLFPKLNEKEIKANNKQKKIMIEDLVKFKKGRYSFVPMGSFTYKQEQLSVQAFYMQTHEVSNLEYRTFLFDLLIQNRKEEFLKSKPDQQQWIRSFDHDSMQTWVNNYFSHTDYNNYPVVNINREGAEMYCTWLTKEINYYLLEQKKSPMNEIRIPSDIEWIYAASGGTTNAIYPWLSDSVRNTNGRFLANLCLKKHKIDFTTHEWQGKNTAVKSAKYYFGAHTTAGLMLGTDVYPAPVYSYSPNIFGIYAMSGNVAEMVYVSDLKNKKRRTHGSKGGSWNSDAEHLKINSEDEYAEKISASPFIGFRPVISVNKINK